MAAQMANLYGVTESLPTAIPKVPNLQRNYPKSYKIKCQSKNIEEIHQNEQQSSSMGYNNTLRSRRTVLGIASIGILTQFGVNPSLAFNQDELWLTGPLPGLPPAENSKYLLSMFVRVYNISWGFNHQLKLLVELVP